MKSSSISLFLTSFPAGVTRQRQCRLARTRCHAPSHPQAHPAKQLPPLPQLSEGSHKAFWKQRHFLGCKQKDSRCVYLNWVLLISFVQLPRASPCWHAVGQQKSILKTYQNYIHLPPDSYAQKSFHKRQLMENALMDYKFCHPLYACSRLQLNMAKKNYLYINKLFFYGEIGSSSISASMTVMRKILYHDLL